MLVDIKSDLYRYIPQKFSIYLLLLGLRSQGFRYMFVRRLSETYRNVPVLNAILKVILRHYTYKYGFQIGGKIGKAFYIGHFGTIIVSVNSLIGDNCNIAPGVIIGATRRGEKLGSPQIGNKVWIGANSIIVGKVKVGNNVLIAPGAFINFDVPDNSIVIGNPGAIRHSINATEDYIKNVYEHNNQLT